MPKSTKKYVAAVREALALGLKRLPGDQESLYSWLSEHQHAWDSRDGQWLSFEDEPANPPTPFVSIRVWCDAEIVADAADCLVDRLTQARFNLVERSDPYPCRPPKQHEARIYLRFYPPKKEIA